MLRNEPYAVRAEDVEGGLRVGDVVHADGTGGIPGDVLEVDIDRDETDPDDLGMVRIAWRAVETTEIVPDLYLLERDEPPRESYRLFVNEARTVFVRQWAGGKVEMATREGAGDTWGPPVTLVEERV